MKRNGKGKRTQTVHHTQTVRTQTVCTQTVRMQTVRTHPELEPQALGLRGAQGASGGLEPVIAAQAATHTHRSVIRLFISSMQHLQQQQQQQQRIRQRAPQWGAPPPSGPMARDFTFVFTACSNSNWLLVMAPVN
jgi:hypothetical protein